MFDAKLKVPCCGVSFGIERLFAIMEARQKNTVRTTQTEVYVASAQKNLVLERKKLLRTLRAAGIKSEMPLKANPKLLTQFQYAEERRIPLVVLIGERELQEGIVKLRNVVSREEKASFQTSEKSIIIFSFRTFPSIHSSPPFETLSLHSRQSICCSHSILQFLVFLIIIQLFSRSGHHNATVSFFNIAYSVCLNICFLVCSALSQFIYSFSSFEFYKLSMFLLIFLYFVVIQQVLFCKKSYAVYLNLFSPFTLT